MKFLPCTVCTPWGSSTAFVSPLVRQTGHEACFSGDIRHRQLARVGLHQRAVVAVGEQDPGL